MEHIYPTDQIPHLWASKAQKDATNAQRNLYFAGDTIYSYGSHFPIARHVTNKQGQAAVLITSRSYSNTTAKHIYDVKRAVKHLTTFSVPSPDSDTKVLLELFKRNIVQAISECYGSTGRFRPTKYTELESLIEEANLFADFFGYKKRWILPETDKVKEAIQKDVARQTRMDAKATAERIKRDAEHDLAITQLIISSLTGRLGQGAM